ncbi:MAG: hypothetical protein WA162_00960, partial [Thermodesulfobacteriota bacterium]
AQVSLMRLLKKAKGAMVFEKAAEKRLANNGGRIEIKKSFVSDRKTGDINASVFLSGYKAAGKTKELTTMKWLSGKGIGRNSLSLIEYWAIDWDYDGKTFKNQWRSFGDSLEKEARIVIEKKPALIAVRAMDVMGNEIKEVFKIR